MLLEGRSRNINALWLPRRALIFLSARQYVLISDSLPVRKSYFDSNIMWNENARILRNFLSIILKQTSTEAHVYMGRHQGGKVKHFNVSNMIYLKFSHGAVSYMLNGENVNVMLEFEIRNVDCSFVELQEKRLIFIPYITLARYCKL